jgi:Fic family protein
MAEIQGSVERSVERWGRYAIRTWRQALTYRAYVPPRLMGLSMGLSLGLAQLLAEAERSLRDLQAGRRGRTGNVQTRHFGQDFEALAHQLLRSESVASSRMEGSRVSHRGLARALYDPGSATRTTRAVVGNVRAMERAIQLGTSRVEFKLDDLRTIHGVLVESAGEPSEPGDVRSSQTWIGGTDVWPHDADYIPPPPEEVLGLLLDLCEFVNRTDLPGLLQAAMAHAQFEAIHPFLVGNGRVGRCLIQVVLRRRGLTPRFLPPVSVVLGNNVTAYVDGLRDYRAGRIEDWCGLFARSTSIAADRATDLATRIEDIKVAWFERAARPRRDSSAAKLLNVLSLRPVVDVAATQRLLRVSDEAARLALISLERRGVLKRVGPARYRRAWFAEDMFVLLDEFDDSMGSVLSAF